MKMDAAMSVIAGDWLTLKDAAGLLHIHQATLRRWADAGEMPHMVTPGGHRRFLRNDVLAFAAAHTVQSRSRSMPEAWATRAMEQARTELPAQAGGHWMQTMSAQTREQHRAIGRKLMALTLQFISSEDDNNAHLLHEARAVGREYGEANLQAGVSLSDSMQAAMFFRDRLLDASLELPDTTRPRHSDQRKLLKRINTLLGVVQLALAEVYEQARAATPAAGATPHRPKKSHPAKTKKRLV
jgi:excisionase family DNA binding protein